MHAAPAGAGASFNRGTHGESKVKSTGDVKGHKSTMSISVRSRQNVAQNLLQFLHPWPIARKDMNTRPLQICKSDDGGNVDTNLQKINRNQSH